MLPAEIQPMLANGDTLCALTALSFINELVAKRVAIMHDREAEDAHTQIEEVERKMSQFIAGYRRWRCGE